MQQWFCVLVLIFALLEHSTSFESNSPLEKWDIASSANVGTDGKTISSQSYNPSANWYPIKGPATVLAGLTQNGLYPDLYFGENLKNVPTAQFDTSWWYRTTFSLSSAPPTKYSTVIVTFQGINYRANIWLNGKQIGDKDTIVGTFRYFDFNITSDVIWGENNVLAVEIFRPYNSWLLNETSTTDLALTFVDWAPFPPDSNMGLWRSTELTFLDGPVSVRYPQISTAFTYSESGVPQDAHLTAMVELQNWADISVEGEVTVSIEGLSSITKKYVISANSTQQVIFDNHTYSVLNIRNPRIWWPWQMGSQEFYTASFTATSKFDTETKIDSRFGIREIKSILDHNKNRLYYVNGQKIMIRGGGWAPDLLLRDSIDFKPAALRLAAQMSYTKAMGLNTIRLEGKFPEEQFYSAADEAGLLLLPGWCCCDSWQHWPYWKEEQMVISRESTRSQIKRLRIHPSILAFIYSSDDLPPENVELNYLKVFMEEKWTLEAATLSCASDRNSKLTGLSGVKMSGPYAWVPPNYWLLDNSENTNDLGGAWGFLTEGGPGAAPMVLESIKKTLSEQDLWPIGPAWDYHCGNTQGNFGSLKYFSPAQNARMGESKSVEDYSYKAQVMAYEGIRSMFEGYNVQKYTQSTGVIQWMLNTAWPGMIWHLYDYYLNPGGAYFGAKKANEVVHPVYNYATKDVWVVNSIYKEIPAGSKLNAEVWTVQGTPKKVWSFSSTSLPKIGSDGVVGPLFSVPEPSGVKGAYLLRLTLHSTFDNSVNDNVYWLADQMDELDWNNSNWYLTPCTKWADFTALQNLENVTLTIGVDTKEHGNDYKSTVTLYNSGTGIAFAVRARVTTTHGDDVLPVFWSDNFVTVFPGEKVTIDATYSKTDVGSDTPQVIVETWNAVVR